MKLVQLLAKELKGWPDNNLTEFAALFVAQDDDGMIVTLDPEEKPDVGQCIGGSWSRASWTGGDLTFEVAEDQKTSIITRDQWLAEREKMNKPKWIRHRGGKCPVKAGTKVVTRYRDGVVSDWCMTRDQDTSEECLSDIWMHSGGETDIMAYYIEETKDQEIEEVETIDTAKAPTIEYAFGDKDSDPNDLDWKQLGTLTYKLEIDATDANKEIDSLVAKWGQIESPLKWRDAIIHCQAIIDDCEREIERNVNLLDAEGLMMQKDSKKAIQHYQTDIDFSDWRNWQIGDRVCATKNFDDVDIGDELIITRLDHADEWQPIGMSAGSSITSWPKMNWVKFVRRP